MKLKEVCKHIFVDQNDGKFYLDFNNKSFRRCYIFQTPNNMLIFQIQDGRKWSCSELYYYLKKLPQDLEIVVSTKKGYFRPKGTSADIDRFSIVVDGRA